MNRKRFYYFGEKSISRKQLHYSLAGLVTLIVVLLMPIIIQEFIANNTSFYTKLILFAIPILVYVMWYNLRKDFQNNSE
jgi:putative effector of murein hydrolase LrgA (UPF0299 family)